MMGRTAKKRPRYWEEQQRGDRDIGNVRKGERKGCYQNFILFIVKRWVCNKCVCVCVCVCVYVSGGMGRG